MFEYVPEPKIKQYRCKMCEKQFRTDQKVHGDGNGNKLCPSCEDTYWNGCSGF